MKFVSQMNETELLTLSELHKNGPNHRLRTRAQILLLNHNSYSITQLCDIFNMTRNSVSGIIDRWEHYGLGGLYDKEKTGRPPINRKKLKSFINNEIKKDGRSLKNILSKTYLKLL